MRKLVKIPLFLFFTALVAILFSMMSYAEKPLWTFVPDPYYPPTVSVTSIGTVTIKYKVTNQSRKTHTLVMDQTNNAITTQVTAAGDCSNPFILGYQQSCTLNLLVNGNALTGNVSGGPIVCQQGSRLQCYQPSKNDILNITRIPVVQYLITPTAGVDGTIAPSTPQAVVAGSNLTFTATPSAGYQVDEWFVDDGVAQKGGTTFTLSNISTNHMVEVSFARVGTIYAGTLSGLVYFSTDNGLTWTTTTTTPSPGNTVNSVFSTPNTLYVGSADGKVYYSTDNGTLWSASSSVPGGVAVNSVFVTTSDTTTIYVGTPYTGPSNGVVYYSTNGGTTWNSITNNPSSAAVNSIFITPSNTIYVGSQDGNVYYSQMNGASWSTISGPQASVPVPIQNVFATNNQLYVNTRQTSSNSTLPNGTIDFEYAYFSNSLTNANPIWTLFSQITYTLFVNSDASVIHAGTQGGYVYSLTTGDKLGFITYSPITSLFFLG